MLQGERKTKEQIELETSDGVLKDPKEIADEFARFFEEKVKKLSSNAGPYAWIRTEGTITVSKEEVIAALKQLKNKMCSGEDGIPLKIIKDSAEGIMDELVILIQKSAKAIPQAWKTSIITPLHKAKNKKDVSNYRITVANLNSISKVFERVILNKLDQLYPGIEGKHQHGFRRNRSTQTAILEIQHEIATSLDRNLEVSMYSLDLSAAFDLLRPGTFHHNVNISPELMNIIMDFLSNRSFKVKVEGKFSEKHDLAVGCVQGSILGPKLFGIYCNGITNVLQDSKIITYADDSYVITTAKDRDILKSKTEASMRQHVTFLKEIGMVVNTDKTELLYSSRKHNQSLTIVIDGNSISSVDHMKALGVFISRDLSWSKHVDHMLNKSSHIIKRINYLAKWLNQKELLQLVTSQYFSIIYYCSPVWIGCLDANTWKRINSAHYRAIRVVTRDFKRRRKRRDLDKETQRATPCEWARYAIASTVIKLYNSSDAHIADVIRSSAYINDRMPRKAKFIDRSRLKVGRQSLQNRIGPLFASISFEWIGELSNDALRVSLKREFFKYSES
jgi:hypothetical protein